VISFPPPSSGGGVLVEILNILEGFDLADLGPNDPAAAHRVVEAMKLAFADRAVWFGDPDFVQVPLARLTSKAYAKKLRGRINPPFWRRRRAIGTTRIAPSRSSGRACRRTTRARRTCRRRTPPATPWRSR